MSVINAKDMTARQHYMKGKVDTLVMECEGIEELFAAAVMFMATVATNLEEITTPMKCFVGMAIAASELLEERTPENRIQ